MATVRIFLTALTLLLANCSSLSETERKQDLARPHPAVYGPDTMYWEVKHDERPYVRWEFYYKHCSISNQNPYPEKLEWSCTDPF
jgi:hypothetical protein